ncbi:MULTISPECIES: hypothetical protein [Streptomyces]|uniref:DUF3618 domain-containing protein n=2 Tax=Streptomyces TaxID=1883 RepID=A0ABQ3QI93_9ACTN|nr:MULTISPECIES: hypothetical protein [Streptomyces]GGU03134.1 hypothetical protein GCM10010289_25080 [Streptomyces violascens]GHI36965.1 hypothetical protein Sviol_13730 [Streptomyces violascens]
MSTDPGHSTTVDELAELRLRLDVGMTRLDGQLALLAQRGEQTERELTDAVGRVAALEHLRWPLPALTVLTAVGALSLAVWQALGH